MNIKNLPWRLDIRKGPEDGMKIGEWSYTVRGKPDINRGEQICTVNPYLRFSEKFGRLLAAGPELLTHLKQIVENPDITLENINEIRELIDKIEGNSI